MKVLIFLADGFEEVEALTSVDYLRRAEIEVHMVSIKDDLDVKGAHDIIVKSDKTMSEVSAKDYDGLIIPGGIPGATNLRDDNRVIDTVKEMYEDDKLTAAICAGPIVLQRAGVLKDKDATSYPGFDEDLKDVNYKDDIVVRDENIITSRGPALAVDFALSIIEYLKGKEKKEEVKKAILYDMK